MHKACLWVLVSLSMTLGCVEDTNKSGLLAVTRIVDGDTIWVDNGTRKGLKIRLIGIDAPETRKSQHKDIGYYGKESSAYLASLLNGRDVELEFDVDSLDQYGRTLAYVYLDDGTFVNAEMIKGGYARVVTYPPNVKYHDQLLQLQRDARRQGLGLWNEQR